MKLKVHRWGYFASAAFYLFVSALEYLDPANALGSPLHRYKWLMCLVAGVGALFFAFRPRQIPAKVER